MMKIVAALIALIYQNQTIDAASVQNIQGALFIFLTTANFNNVFGVVNVFFLSFLKHFFKDLMVISKTKK